MRRNCVVYNKISLHTINVTFVSAITSRRCRRRFVSIVLVIAPTHTHTHLMRRFLFSSACLKLTFKTVDNNVHTKH
nr:Caab099 [Calliteara abietis nucleopolyhedrovirus]